MKYLGIDFGTKRVGLAVAPDGGTMAFPLCVILNTHSLIEDIVAICQKEHIDAIVIGESLNFQNLPNPIMKKIGVFMGQLKTTTSLPIFLMNEVLSSREAMHLQGDNPQNDASAAAIILQSYLDKHFPKLQEEFSDDE
ncbi:MAG: hypothetical protein A2845_05775 [Candidatus Lloydbacteria bacterium RIFCSPHIGHO2_01_FULL_49_22]|uniref:Putative pre-16S rRNA nuclease n=1 Tax=Candidatus Lloydbacteria bacterium RIFCSPHIGHO2_01_FULL_49_22 TaxID=1798658 RepID=A0A1G2CW79_9BACT|nr:MAG: hypothetical protein A2845_05775 [Candidatus Lloydbacteria bacterium RIFCSPHIGHO2_01_FULL_49_22]OGZ09808.1 MAG: hypothetical protein A3C14_00240 [Candidatus Lloydbacteria bacterium RIFCSPHIGHO2_02_FULL_50_18]